MRAARNMPPVISNNRHVEIVCADLAHVNVSVFYQFVDTANRAWPTSVAPRRGFSRSGSTGLGRSQKDGLPSGRGERLFITVQSHQLAHRGGAAWSLPLSNRKRDMDAKTRDLALLAALIHLHRRPDLYPPARRRGDRMIAIMKRREFITLLGGAAAE